MKIEIENIDGFPWILFTSENDGDWLRLIRLRDEIFGFEEDKCYGQYEIYMKFKERERQFSIKLDNTAMDDEIEKMK